MTEEQMDRILGGVFRVATVAFAAIIMVKVLAGVAMWAWKTL